MQKPVLVSACLLGALCRYDGQCKTNRKLVSYLIGRTVVPICPEVMGGLTVPRPPVTLVNGTGAEILQGKAAVVTENGQNCTEQFIKGALISKQLAEETKAKVAILKARSPSCGKDGISLPDGSSVKGNGITAELLIQSKLKVICCEFDCLPDELLI